MRRLLRAGVVLGIGLGGFADGIALHQIAQWHNMGSAVLPPDTLDGMRQNMIWDGLFHAATWLITLMGVFILSREGRNAKVPAARAFAGQMVFGWGLFNLVEGLIDHHVPRVDGPALRAMRCCDSPFGHTSRDRGHRPESTL